MSYSFDRGETIGEGLARNARSQVDDAIRHLDDPEDAGFFEAVHDVRKRCKKLRGLARMVRSHIGEDRYEATNEAFRDVARELSDVRDAQVMVEVVDELVASVPEEMHPTNVADTRAELTRRSRSAVKGLECGDGRIERARALVEDGWDQIRAWEIPDDFDVLAGGIRKTYKRAVKAREAAWEGPTTEHLHEWRKRVKYHWYHLRMLTDASPELLEPWADRLHDLADALGDNHDLAVLVDVLTGDPEAFGDIDGLRLLAEGRRAALQEKAFSLGARLTTEDPDAVLDRLRIQWEAWKAHGNAPRAVELADLPA